MTSPFLSTLLFLFFLSHHYLTICINLLLLQYAEQPGSYLQASVMQDGKDYHFSVVVPPGATPGETVLTVPVPIPKTTVDQSPYSSRDTSNRQHMREQESESSGEDVIASFLMDRGIEPGSAIEASHGLVAAGINTSSKLQTGNIGEIARASGLSGDDLRRVFDNRHPQVLLYTSSLTC